MTKETLKSEIQLAITALLEMAEETCTNTLSYNLTYLVSEIKSNHLNFAEERKIRIRENNSKRPISFNQAIDQLLNQYDNLYDISLSVHKAKKNQTIIDVRFYPLSSLDPEYREIARKRAPMLHCKIANPSYHKGNKFDVNWEHGGLKHAWKLYWYRKKILKEIEGLKIS